MRWHELQASRVGALFGRVRRGPERLGWRAMPWLMRAGTVGSVLFAGVWVSFVPLAALNVGTYTINDRVVSGPYFLGHAGPILLPFIVLLLAIAYGYWTERLWARPLPILFWFAIDLVLLWEIVTGDATGDDAVAFVVWGVLYIAAALWYCFFKESVARYYRALERAYGGDAPPVTRPMAGVDSPR